METKGKSELVFSQNNCVRKRGFVVLIKALQIILKLYVCKPFLNLFLSMMGQGNHSLLRRRTLGCHATLGCLQPNNISFPFFTNHRESSIFRETLEPN